MAHGSVCGTCVRTAVCPVETTAVAHGGNPQDRAASPRPRCLPKTALPPQDRAASLYAARWGIETMFKDYKTGGYNLEKTRVNERRLIAIVLLIAIAYTLATFQG
ncbi:MAG: transposase [Moorea sp. SIOASIH]|nr:transposase [Moorena sp. SIOASIH]